MGVYFLRGGGHVVVSSARPSLDDRYALGHCEACTPEPVSDPQVKRARPATWPTVALVRADHWNPDTLRERAERKREQRIVRGALAGKLHSDADIAEYQAILARHEAEAAARREAQR